MSRSNDSRVIRVLQFLDAYERQESLWNPALESYKNKIARDEAYMHIIKELNNPSLSIHDIKLKVKSIRTTYTKELRLVTKNKELGKAYIPKLFWFNRANAFLKDVSLSRDKRSIPLRNSDNILEEKHFGIDCASNGRIINSEECDDLSNEVEDAAITSCAYEYKLLQQKSNGNASSDDMVACNITERQSADDEQIQSFPSNHTIDAKFSTTPISDVSNTFGLKAQTKSISTNSGEDEYDFFCRSVAMQLRSISDTYSRSVAKLKIQQILFEAETGHYRNSPCITIPVNQPITSL